MIARYSRPEMGRGLERRRAGWRCWLEVELAVTAARETRGAAGQHHGSARARPPEPCA